MKGAHSKNKAGRGAAKPTRIPIICEICKDAEPVRPPVGGCFPMGFLTGYHSGANGSSNSRADNGDNGSDGDGYKRSPPCRWPSPVAVAKAPGLKRREVLQSKVIFAYRASSRWGKEHAGIQRSVAGARLVTKPAVVRGFGLLMGSHFSSPTCRAVLVDGAPFPSQYRVHRCSDATKRAEGKVLQRFTEFLLFAYLLQKTHLPG